MHKADEGVVASRSEFDRRQFVGYATLAVAAATIATAGCAADSGGGSQPGSTAGLPTVSNVEELRGFDQAGPGTQVRVLGLNAPGDGGEGVFAYSPAYPTRGEVDDNVGFVVQSRVPALANGRWRRVSDSQAISVRWFGAVGDGKAIDSNPIAYTMQVAASAHARMLVPGGIYLVDGLARRVSMMDVSFTDQGGPVSVLADRVAQTGATVYYFADA